MAGMSFKAGLGSFAGPGTQPAASSVGEAAFGPSYSGSVAGQGVGALTPVTPTGIGFWGGVAGAGVLGWLWYSLPSSGSPNRRTLELVIISLVAWQFAKVPTKLVAQRVSQDVTQQGLGDKLARAVNYALS